MKRLSLLFSTKTPLLLGGILLLALIACTSQNSDEDHLNNPSIVVLTLVKRDNDEKNYIQLKKIKLYIDESNKKIIKILEN